MKRTFLSYEKPLLTCMVQADTPDRIKELVAKSLPEGAEMLYVTQSGEGEGLLFYGNVILPFVDHFPTDLELYKIMTTKWIDKSVQKDG